MFHSADGSEGVSALGVIGRHRLVGGEEKGGRVSNGFGFEIRRIGFKWSKWVKWSGVE